MKDDPSLPRLIALALLAVLAFIACTPGHARPSDVCADPMTGPLRTGCHR